MLLTQPYPINDFSGGMTENFIQGGPTKYLAADNFIVTTNRKLEMRYGSVILDSTNYLLPSGNNRVGTLINFDNDTAILAQSGPYLYWYGGSAGSWNAITGPTGNPALPGADATHRVSSGMFQHQMYLTHDSSYGYPTKVYVDPFGNYQTRTAGLPGLPAIPNYAYGPLLTACTTLANDILARFIAHTNSTQLHQAVDNVTASLLLTAVPATSLTTLLTLCSLLQTAYTAHIGDAQLSGSFRAFHQNNVLNMGGYAAQSTVFPGAATFQVTLPTCLNIPLVTTAETNATLTADLVIATASDAPDLQIAICNTNALASAALFLDDLLTKYKMHVYAPFTHDLLNNCSVIGQNIPTTGHINYVAGGPDISPNFGPMFSAVQGFMTQFNAHALSGNIHVQFDYAHQISCPAPTDSDSLFIAIAHCRAQYNQHQVDSLYPFFYGGIDTTLGGSSIQHGVVYSNPLYPAVLGNPANITFPNQQSFGNGMTVVDLTANQALFNVGLKTYTTISAASNASTGMTFTMAAPGATTTTSDQASGQLYFVAQWSFSSYHWSTETAPTTTQIPANTLTQVGVDLASWAAIFTALSLAYNAHDASTSAHTQGPMVAQAVIQDVNLLASVLALLNPIVPTATVLSFYQQNVPVPAIAQYVYGFHYMDTYTVGNLEFEVVGPVTLVGPIETPVIETAVTASQQSLNQYTTVQVAPAPVTISNIPPLPYSSAGTNYDLANIQVNACRTIDAGATLFQLAALPNGQSTYIDSVGDTSATTPGGLILIDNPTIYTSGNVVNFDPAPQCKYLHIFNGTAYFGGVWDTGQFFANRVRQSIAFAPDSSPRAFYDDFDDIVMGISSTRSNVVVFCKNSTYRSQGQFNSLGQGAMTHERISDTVGCLWASSIVKTELGIFWASQDGFYYTDGNQVIKLSSELNLTYLAMTQTAQQQRNLYGTYDKWHRRVWWSTQPDPGDSDVSQSWVLHLDFGVSTAGVFTTASGGDSYRPSSMLFFQNTQYRGDARGYLFLHSPLYKSDPLVAVGTAATLWNTQPLPYNYTSCAIDFGSTFNRKWVPRISLTSKNEGNYALSIVSINDLGKSQGTLAVMNYNANLRWGTPGIIWGSNTPLWNQVKQPDMWRRFPAGQMRCDFKQIVCTPAQVGLYNSEQYPVGASANITPVGLGATATLAMNVPTGYTSMFWPVDVVGYVIAFSTDGYLAEYPITVLSGDTKTITVSLPTNVTLAAILAGTHLPWVIRGVNKNGKLSLTAINIHFALMGKEQDAYQGVQSSGENT